MFLQKLDEYEFIVVYVYSSGQNLVPDQQEGVGTKRQVAMQPSSSWFIVKLLNVRTNAKHIVLFFKCNNNWNPDCA